ncbi:MAG: iron uptake porin [Scytolyngbya sp. HA4215-MV1]|nr:iron uptake porin [Scytolyngbya sp. HA4215-MV1]
MIDRSPQTSSSQTAIADQAPISPNTINSSDSVNPKVFLPNRLTSSAAPVAVSQLVSTKTQTVTPDVGLAIPPVAVPLPIQQAQARTVPSSLSPIMVQDETVSPGAAQNPEAPEEEMAQVTSVSQLNDVQPTDWAFQALQSLVERYGCIAGYPDGTFKGNRALTRYEFAAGVNACLDRVNELIGSVGGVSKDDLLTLQKLQEEFAAELATLRGRVDALEARTTELEKNQFSTTTKLFGQVVVGVQGRDSGDIQLAGFNFKDEDTNINVINNVQLSLFTQLSDRSLLLTGLQSGGGKSFSSQLLTNDVLLGYEGDTGNDFVVSDLTYRHLLGNNFAVIAGPIGVNMVNVFRGANRVESAGQGPLSRFAQRNPIQNINGDGGGIGFDWQITNRISLQAVYSANRSNDPGEGGLFGGDNGATTIGAQLTLAPTNNIDIALNYVNAYSPSGNIGAGVGDDLLALPNPVTFRAPLKTNAFGATVAWRISRSLTLGAWGGYTNSYLPGEDGNVETVNWMAFLNLPNLGGRGNLGGLYIGQPPRITSSDLPVGRNVPDFVSNGGIGEAGDQPSSTTHIEAFYRIRLTNNISVTPGVIFVINPRNNSENDNITIGAIRTTFSF